MTRFETASIVLLCCCAVAAAPSRAEGPPAESPFEGGFIGLDFGYAHGSWDRESGEYDGNDTLNDHLRADGAVGGVLGGYNHVFDALLDGVVLGIVADFQATNLEDLSFPASTDSSSQARLETQWFGTLRARAGVLLDPNLMVYATGGMAYGRVIYKMSDGYAGDGADLQDGSWAVGWTVGTGAELALGGGLTAGIEYLYADLGDERLGENITRSTDEEFTSRFDTEHHILRATLSYYFCGPEKRGGVFGTADSREDAWNGFFAGLNFGFVSADWKRSGIFDGNELWNKKVSDSAAGGGMQVGYNYYLNRAVLGVVSDFQLTNAEGRAIPASTDDDSEVRLDTPWWGTLRARFGYEIKPEVLLYLTGGLAYGKVEWESYDDNSPPAGVDAKDWIVGWTVGGGAEIAINKRVSLGLEYLYVDLGKTNDLTRKVANSTGDEYTEDVTASMHVPRVSLNFHF